MSNENQPRASGFLDADGYGHITTNVICHTPYVGSSQPEVENVTLVFYYENGKAVSQNVGCGFLEKGKCAYNNKPERERRPCIQQYKPPPR